VAGDFPIRLLKWKFQSIMSKCPGSSKWTITLLALMLMGCGVEKSASVNASASPTISVIDTGQTGETSPPEVLTASTTLQPDNPLIVEVEVSLNRSARVYIKYENKDAGMYRTATTESAAKEHAVPVVRLKPSTKYSYQVFAVDSAGREFEGVSGTFKTGQLPPTLAAINFHAQGQPTPEVILMSYWDAFSSYILALDRDSEVVWYYLNPGPVPDTWYRLTSVRQKQDYNLVYIMGVSKQPCCLREITPKGEIVDSLSYSDLDGVPHHDHLILPDNRVLYLSATYRIIDDTSHGGDPRTLVEGTSIRVWDQNTGTTQEIWNSFDALSTDVRGEWRTKPLGIVPGETGYKENIEAKEWNRGNSLQIGPRNNYVVFLKELSQVISISPDLKYVEWTLGGPESDFVFRDPADRFYKSHTAAQLPNGNVLLFDNGTDRPEEEGGEYSRALEVTADLYDLSAVKVWEYRPNHDIFSKDAGSAIRLENGNTIVNFGLTPDVLLIPVMVVEVTRDGAEVWKLEITSPTMNRIYRAQPLESIMGETRLR